MPLQMLPDMQYSMLKNAVHLVAELRQIQVQADQFCIQSGKDLTYEEYCDLLLSAAQQYNGCTQSSGSTLAKQQIYNHDFSVDDDYDEAYLPYDGVFDIDQSIHDLHINDTNFKPAPQLSYPQWQALPEAAQKIWNSLDQEAKTIIL